MEEFLLGFFLVGKKLNVVHDKHVGLVKQHLRHADALPVAFRQLADAFFDDGAESAALHNFVDSLPQPWARHAARYLELLAGVPGIEVPVAPPAGAHVETHTVDGQKVTLGVRRRVG
jgi:hypothetical protein